MKKILIYCSLLMLAASSSFAQHEKSVRGHERNPWYSNTDTTRLTVNNAAWKKVLPPICMRSHVKKLAAALIAVTLIPTVRTAAVYSSTIV